MSANHRPDTSSRSHPQRGQRKLWRAGGVWERLALAVLLSSALSSALRPSNKREEGVQASVSPTLSARVQTALSRLPLYFIENRGQVDGQVAYYVQGRETSLYFTAEGITFALSEPTSPHPSPLSHGEREGIQPVALHAEPQSQTEPQRWVLKLEFVEANPSVVPKGQGLTPAVVSYFKGPQEQWQTGLPTYNSVLYPNLWPGIDLVYSGTGDRLKYTFVVKPGADPSQIKLAYRGAAAVTLTDSGQLTVTTPVGGFADDTPYAYQQVNEQRVKVAAAYTLEADPATDAQVYGFRIGNYDPRQELIIDPAVLVYAGFIGGFGASLGDSGNGIAVDSAGSAYVVGTTNSTEATFPVTAGPDLTYNGGDSDAFVAKVKADGTGLVYAGFIGGSGADFGNGVAVDSTGNAYVTGTTSSTEATFPVSGGPDLTYNGGINDAFVAKIKADGTGLVYAGYIGGSGDDFGNGIAVDKDGHAYVTGYTSSIEATFPVVGGPDLTFNGGHTFPPGAFIRPYDAFVAKINAAGTELDYAGYIGGSSDDYGNGIAVDTDGNAYVIGLTSSDETTFPVAVGPDLTHNGGYYDAFVAKVKADGTGLVYAGYIGGNSGIVCTIGMVFCAILESGTGIAVDNFGNAYVTGFTESGEATFPVVGGPDLTLNGGGRDAFVAKVKADGTGFVYAGYIGGSGDDYGTGIAVDGEGNAYVTGYTASTEATFPVVGGPDLTYNGGAYDAFVAKVKADGTGLVYAGYIGGSGSEGGIFGEVSINGGGGGIAVDSVGNAYVTGFTAFTALPFDFPAVVGPDLTYNGGPDAFVVKISSCCSAPSLVAAVLPNGRSVQVGTPATAFASMINAGSVAAVGCGISPITNLPAEFHFRPTNCATNQVIGTLDTPIDIPAGATQCFVFAFTPTAPIAPTDVTLDFDCANTNSSPTFLGVNTLLLSASNTPVPDIVVLGTTCKSDDGIPLTVNLPGANGAGAFAVATDNVGAAGSITVTADTGGVSLPVSLSLCQTNPGTGACLAAPSSSVTLTIGTGATPTFAVFVQGSGTIVFDPATKRVFVRFKDGSNVVRGETSVAVRTHSPACAP